MDRYLDILHRYWGYPDFRGIQRQIIESVGSGHDTLGLMPTGGGKSITFQVPAMAMKGVCIVITPLISLMKDQVDHLRQRGIAAAAIFSGMTREEILITLDNCVLGDMKLLYVAPERLASKTFRVKLSHMRVSMITVDEAHCISQWGYDFRPSYLHIADIREIVPDVPVLALTATATPAVIDDIQEKLAFREKRVFRMSFARSNLSYIVRNAQEKDNEMVHILRSVPGSAIIYVRSRKNTKAIALMLSEKGISASWYHAGLDTATKTERQNDWQQDKTRVIVATNAFGMGIDKADVRLVIHADCPDSIEAYFQEAGRAGRDGKRAYAVLLFNDNDAKIMRWRIANSFPAKKEVAQIYEHLAYFFQLGVGSGEGVSYNFDIYKFCHYFHHSSTHVTSALTILKRAGYLVYEPNPDNEARLRFLLSRDDLYRLHSNSPAENNIITTLLRLYSGLFVDYAYIDGSIIAKTAGIGRDECYLLLKGLSQKHIISFIPKSNTPFITYTRDRVDCQDIVLPPEAYDMLKEQYVRRINAITAYASSNDTCRSRQLLAYFGETDTDDCHHCDVCISRRDASILSETRQRILAIVADSEHHRIDSLYSPTLPTPYIDKALKQLIAEEIIAVEYGEVYMIKKR